MNSLDYKIHRWQKLTVDGTEGSRVLKLNQRLPQLVVGHAPHGIDANRHHCLVTILSQPHAKQKMLTGRFVSVQQQNQTTSEFQQVNKYNNKESKKRYERDTTGTPQFRTKFTLFSQLLFGIHQF
jgi:hypothetical protein